MCCHDVWNTSYPTTITVCLPTEAINTFINSVMHEHALSECMMMSVSTMSPRIHGSSGACPAGGQRRSSRGLGLGTREGTRVCPGSEDTWRLRNLPCMRVESM
jgi:hypothetical protein